MLGDVLAFLTSPPSRAVKERWTPEPLGPGRLFGALRPRLVTGESGSKFADILGNR
jgi:hypothetical protein